MPVPAIEHKLRNATPTELSRLREHLSLPETSTIEHIIESYLEAADNTIASLTRPLMKTEAPTYTQILRLIYRELRSYGEALDETWRAVRSIKFWAFKSAVKNLDVEALEERIFAMYAAEYSDAKKKSATDPTFWAKASTYLPALGGATASAVATASAATATRLPFAGLAPGLVAGPAGIALSVVLIGVQASGPAFRKIVPATVELILIGRRIQFMPET